MNAATVKSVVRFVIACVACNVTTHGRCRNRRSNGGPYCTMHQKMVDAAEAPAEAMPPDIILFKRKISLNRAKKLMGLGVKEEEGKDPAVKLTEAIEDARRQRRSPDIGKGKHGGTLVIDNPTKEGGGAKKITVLNALVEIADRYEIASLHLEPEKNQNPHVRMLIVGVVRKGDGVPSVVTDAIWSLLRAIFEGTFDVWVWANTPKEDTGIVVHTVNLGMIYQKEKPSDPEIVPDGHLHFDENAPGQWVLKETAVA